MLRTSLRYALACTLIAACNPSQDDGNGSGDDQAHVRVAHLSPDAPAVDFCIAPHGTTTFIGPVLATNGGADGLSYGNVTKYLDLAPQQYDVRLVAPGAADCTTPLGGLADFTDLPELPAGSTATIAAEGLVALTGGSPFHLAAYLDDDSVAVGNAKLRFIHASPGTPAVDVGTGGGVIFSSVFSDVAFGDTAASGNGYITTPPLANVEISARVHGQATDALSITPASLPAGAIATAFAIGQVGSSTAPLRVLLCDDNAAPTGLLSQCQVVGGTPSRAHVRVAHLSPDLRAVDVCLAQTGTNAFSGPILRSLGVDDGLTYAAVTAYVDLPVSKYDVRVILANASGCDSPAIPDTVGIAVDGDETATIAAVGDSDPSGAAANDPALHLEVFEDATTAATGQAKLRFIHASPGTPAVDVGLGQGAGFTKVFADVSFGNVATNAGIDALGFVQTSAPVTSAVSARLANATQDALTIPSVTLQSEGVFTAFAIGGKTGASDKPLQVLLCDDNAAPSGALSACSIAP
jgi:hypothetical protein|nr:DUF4397 domain-containing protein [Kofleriaceae bacterium]